MNIEERATQAAAWKDAGQCNCAPLCSCPECVRNAVLALGEVLGE